MSAALKIPYELIPAVALEQRRAHMKAAIARGLPRLQRNRVDEPGVAYIACYGPSLRDTYEELRGKHPLLSMSGATKFLAERGIVADYAIEMDPRPSQLTVSLPPVPGVAYLVASCVVPEYFDAVLAAGNETVLWHTVSSNWPDELQWVAVHDEGQLVVSTGSTVGLAAIQIGGVLGYRRFEIHGMDGSFRDGERHAGAHGGKEQFPTQVWPAAGKKYRTSKIMSNACAEAVNTMRNYPITAVFHGDGLTQALIREADLPNACCADETEKRARLQAARIEIAAMPPLKKGRLSFWEAVMDFLQPGDLPELVSQIARCEARRPLAHYNTGTVPFESAVFLRAVCRFYKPKVIAEVGTFIGTSTEALLPERVTYTCDLSNDCLPSSDKILAHPKTKSLDMLREIQEPVDLFFFDGRLSPEDVTEVMRLSHPGTVYVFDDYVGNEKGKLNAVLLGVHLPRHLLVGPDKLFEARGVTLAVMVPKS